MLRQRYDGSSIRNAVTMKYLPILSHWQPITIHTNGCKLSNLNVLATWRNVLKEPRPSIKIDR